MDRVILHVDFDSFFASVMQQDYPELRDKPIGIIAHNGRTAIIAASREAKRMGVTSPTRTYIAQQKCPNIKFVRADFIRYFEISKKFLEIANLFSPTVELFSIDEVFMDVTDTLPLFGSVENLVRQLKMKLAKAVGPYITVSVGVSYNKMLAKLASGTHKPNGLYTLTHENREETYRGCELMDICGIGGQTKKHLNRIGIYHLLDLASVPLEKLLDEFGDVEGHFLKNVGLGIDTSEVVPYTQGQDVKSISRQYCLPENVYNKRMIDQTVYELGEEVAKKLRRLKKTARIVGFSLYGDSGWHTNIRSHEFMDTGKQFFDMYRAQKDRFAHMSYVRRISVYASGLHEKAVSQQSLFTDNHKWETIYKTMDAINDRFGDGTLRNGFVHQSELLTTVPNGFMADKWEREQLMKLAV